MTVGQQLAVGAGTSLVNGAMQALNAPGQAKPITPEKQAEMPTANDAAVQAAKRKSIAQQMAARGRASTIMSDNDKLG